MVPPRVRGLQRLGRTQTGSAESSVLTRGRRAFWSELAAKDEGLIGGLSAAAAICVLLVRLVPDVRSKPLHGDEAVSGLVANRPFWEMLDVVITDRGGPPLHYVLAHIALLLDESPSGLRGVSVVAVVAAIPAIFDLGRRLGGPSAGGAAALVAALCPFMGIYGTLGRPYGLFILMSALALDLFVRAVERRTLAASAWAAGSAVVAAATHPYGLFIVAVEGMIGLALWRFRPLRGLIIPFGAMILALPVLASVDRLGERFRIGQGEAIADARLAARQLLYALQGSAAGGVAFIVIVALAFAGFLTLAQRRSPVAVLAGALIAFPPAVYLLAPAAGAAIAPRHLLFLLPIWTALVGVAVARLIRPLPVGAAVVGVAALALVVGFSQTHGVFDQRTRTPEIAANNAPTALQGPARFLERVVSRRDVLYGYSPPFLFALRASARARVVGFGPGGILERSFERVEFPVEGIVVPVPVGRATIDRARLVNAVRPGVLAVFRRWVLIRMAGPYQDEAEALQAIAVATSSIDSALSSQSPLLDDRLRLMQGAACSRIMEIASEGERASCRR